MTLTDPLRPSVLFDLDGTLTDSFVGITRSLQHVLEKLGRIAPSAEDLRWCIGPPIHSNIAVLLDTDDAALIEQGIELYRERYGASGKFESELIEGIPETLSTLAQGGVFMAVATSKLKTFAAEIIEHFGLGGYFHAVHGSELDGSNSVKAELIAHILADEDLDAANAVMIGDRSHDIVGARANGVASIGVLWGFGDRAELVEAGADHIAARPAELAG